MKTSTHYAVIVVGGGHAGTEAALASSRMGAKTLLVTQNIDTLGQMSCNPAIGGLGKSHLVREIDALGGIMAKATDHAGIQFRTLNAKKGPAVRATRAQTDRLLYKSYIREELEKQKNLHIFQQSVCDLIIKENRVLGVTTQTEVRFFSDTVILATGTFLGGKIHIGLKKYEGGRAGEKASNELSAKLKEKAFRVEQLKTGTPPRLDARSVVFSKMEEQKGETPIPFMSFSQNETKRPTQRSCYITKTNEKTHEIIRKNLNKSPLYTGVISGVGPRYCPSVEDKVERFSDKKSHQVFIEPEGLTTQELYPNGVSTSLPFSAQIELIQTIEGLENAHITRPGYAIEYDYLNPKDLKQTLETKHTKNLFFAGQINGTTGYEEAAAQGLLAGANAALKVQEKEPWCPGRDQAYIGVMIDDLITMGTTEPYRMFTSRAEYRLLLREDNADQRLTPKGKILGLVGEKQWRSFQEKQEKIQTETKLLEKQYIQPETKKAKKLFVLTGIKITKETSLIGLLKRPEITYETISLLEEEKRVEKEEAKQIEINCKYNGYINRQKEEIKKIKRSEETVIPKGFDYEIISGLSTETKQKLLHQQPDNLGQASRIPGVTPAAISLLLIFLKKKTYTKTINKKAV